MQVSLQVSHNKANVRRVVVTHDAVIGRGSECNLRIAAQHVSRQHCRLILAENGVFVRDLGSSNGTFVQGERITINEDIYIEPGSELSVGGVKFVVDYTLDGEVPASAAADAADVADDADIEPADQSADPDERTLNQFGEWAGETLDEELADAQAAVEPVELDEVAAAVPADAVAEAAEDVYEAFPVDEAVEVVEEVAEDQIVEVAEALDEEVVEVGEEEIVEEVYDAVPVEEVVEVEEVAEIVEVVEEVPVEVVAEVSEDDIADFLTEPVVQAPPPPKPAPAAKSAPVGKSRPAPAPAPASASRGKRKGPAGGNEIVEEESLSDFLKKLGD